MKIRRIPITLLALSLALFAFVASAEVIPFDLEFGYRVTSVGGNEDMYRTQINEDEGFLLRSFTLNTAGNGLFEHVRIDASDLGAGPAGSLRVETGNQLYRFNLRYRDADHYSALPRFANPFAEQGVVPGQHRIDRNREMFDVDLDFLPGRKFSPFVGYSRNDYSGPGQTTYTFGGDDFRLRNDLDESEDEFRIGANLNFGMVYGQITQGWRSFSSDENLNLVSGAGDGNNPGTVLGRPQTAIDITRNESFDGDAPFTNAFAVIQPTERIRFIANYIDSSLEGDGTGDESAAGSFLSFPISSFFDRFTETATSSANTDITRYGARAEIGLTPNIDLVGGYRTEDRDMSGTALLNTIFFNAVTFGGVNRGNVAQLLNTESSLEREENVWDIGVQARGLGPIGLRVAYLQTSQDVDYSPDLEEIVVPGNQSGEFDRSIDTLDATVTFAQSGVMFSAALRLDEADDPILRTDFLDRQRVRVRAGYRSPNQFFRVGLLAEETDSENDSEASGFDGEYRQFTGDVEVTPLPNLILRGSYSLFDTDTTISIRRPENFNIETSRQLEDGKAIEGGLTFLVKRFTVDADYTTFENNGTLAFDMVRYRARVAYDFVAKFGLAAEWFHDDYQEAGFPLADYDADRFGLFLRFRR